MRTPRPTVFIVTLALVSSLLGACSSGSSDSRTVLVDAGSDEFAGTFRAYFPRDVAVKPGMTVKFHQTWTGEPHTVTLGTEVQDRIEPEMLPLILDSIEREPGQNGETFSDEVNAAVEKFFGELPFFFGEKGVVQSVGQPCVLKTGLPPASGEPCDETELPPFTGRESYYNSGFIPYLGENGNDFELKIADDAKPGTYFYYCALHGAGMSGQIKIVEDGDIPSQAAVNRKAAEEKKLIELPLENELKKEQDGESEFTGNLAGSIGEPGIKGQVNEFTPRTVEARVGQQVKWTFIGAHTISFNVPPYIPWYDVKDDGTVAETPTVYEPAGGWPGRPNPTGDEEDGPPVPAENVVVGNFDGSGGLKSSGAEWQTGDTYSVTFTKPGTYPMACLIHPGMIGKVVVS